MKIPLLPFLFCTLATRLLAASSLRAEGVDELLAKLRVEVEKSVAEAKASKSSSTSNTYQLDQNLGRLENAIIRDNFEEAEQALTQLAVTRLTVEAKGLINQLQREVPKAAEERQKAYVVQVGAAIEKAGKTCLAAKVETDLDATVAELGALRQRRTGSSSEPRDRLNTRIESALRFVTRWQEFLVQKSRGYEGTARGILRDLADPSSSSGNQYFPLVPRDEIIARMGKVRTPDDILRSIKNLDELPKAIADLHVLSSENDPRRSSTFDGTSPIHDLNNLSKAHAAFKAGAYGNALQLVAQVGSTSSAASAETIRLKTLLFAEVLPRHLELPDNPQPKADENPSQFLLRLAGEGVAKNDWARVARALDAYRSTAFGFQAPGWVAGDLEAAEAYIAGQNLEKANRFAAAVIAYQRAVKSSGKFSPAERATARLTALEKEQPAAFAEATKEPPLREVLESLRSRKAGTLGMPASDF